MLQRTGQISCHGRDGEPVDCAGSGQDGETLRGAPWPQPRFAPGNGSTVEDRLTGLVWSSDAACAEFPLTWDEALDYVDGLNRRSAWGFGDWRLPNRRELRSLIDHQTRRPALPHDHPFENVFLGFYWSATSVAGSPAHAWYVSMDGGRMFWGGKDQSFMVWPVRGEFALAATGQRLCYDSSGHQVRCAGTGQDGEILSGSAWPEQRFEPQGESVLDRLTGLLWRTRADLTDGPVNWPDALEAVARLGSGWRLPNIVELESLVDCSRSEPALPAGNPFQAVAEGYWSATTSCYEPDWAWALYTRHGAVGVGQKRDPHFHVWAVRDHGPEASPT